MKAPSTAVKRQRQANRLNRARAAKILLGLIVIILLLVGSPGINFAADGPLAEVRSLLQDNYVDPVSGDVLSAPTVADMLSKLGDPHTVYFSQAEYQNFLNSLEQTFSGIGVRIDIVPEGVLIQSVLKGAPAEQAGLQAGDIITEAAGQALAGLSGEQAVSILRGPDGSQVTVKVKRRDSVLNFTVSRARIEDPTVTGKLLDGHIGYISISSFASVTPQVFAGVVGDLRNQKADSWIIDLRDNPGGYLSSAIDLAGYFIGNNVAVQVKDRTDPMQYYNAPYHGLVLDDPIIFLVNENSASASEILTAAVKDYKKAVVVGTKTYGKGTVQSMFGLSDGSVLKMTIARFYSPNGVSNDKAGILPNLNISGADAETAAELLLADTPGPAAAANPDFAMVTEQGENLAVSLAQARRPEYWPVWGAVLNNIKIPSDMTKAGTGNPLWHGSPAGWTAVTAPELAERWPLYYPGYKQLGDIQSVSLDKKFTVHFRGTIDWQTVNGQSVELIDADNGQRVELEFHPLGNSDLQLVPRTSLQPGTTYWLVVNSSVLDIRAAGLEQGAIAVVHTAGEKVPATPAKYGIQSKETEQDQKSPDYGLTIFDRKFQWVNDPGDK